MSTGGKTEGERTITLVGVVTALALFGDSMLYVVLPVYWKEAGLDALWQVGVLLAANRFVRLPLNPLVSWLYRRMSLRTGLIIAAALGAATTAGYGIWKGFAAWLILRAVWGIAWSFMRMGGYLAVIACSDDSNRGRLMGRYNGVWRLGTLVGVLFGGLLVPKLGLQPVALQFGAWALLGIPLVLWALRGKSASAREQPARAASLKGTMWTLPVRKIVVSGLAIAVLQAVFGATLSYMIDTHYAGRELLFQVVISSTVLGGALTALRCAWEPFLAGWSGRLSDGPQGRLPLYMLSLAGSAAGYAFLPWELPLGVWLAIVIFVMATSTLLGTIMDAMAADAARATAVVPVITAYTVATDLGAAVGPTLVYGIAGEPFGLVFAYVGCAAVFAAVAMWYRPEYRERRAAG
ncbi:Predicted arabinose efflux permease, MFS family [Paenibacillus sp. UNCCL117]|uniref:MFS transporter n=1 Tax=unclassified Paenibacillus TaxID=185978 RepID=UPI00088EBB2C|nr:MULTISPECIES: MFS transporter [unclassified Paenibacillus]SDE49536.1 Predicted arabinose efflux permease, MFS family [Paenibacillus sp. cl123]SFW66915.1 Predicted arabinose efflux permease, MFS family [Paenibacillus sp. UNCCL117]